jgi:hypothetical protein
VLDGEGVATRKYDGTSCLVSAAKLFKRYEVKKGRPDHLTSSRLTMSIPKQESRLAGYRFMLPTRLISTTERRGDRGN